MTSIVGVHGVGNYDPAHTPKQAAERLARIWTMALRTNLAAAPIDLQIAYYAAHLQTEIPQHGEADPEQLPPDAQQMVLEWATVLGAPDEVTQGAATLPLRQVGDWIARRYGLDQAAVRWFVAAFFGEVAAYLKAPNHPARDAARDHVATVIAADKPAIVIAHSLGSVLAYEALHAHPDLNIDLLITVGSPLGMPDVVLDRLLPRPSARRRRPHNVRRWVNIADVGDIIAIPRGLGGQFELDEDHEVDIALFDFHRVKRYLANQITTDTIMSAIEK